MDKEELRADKAVKVTRKELNNLIAELFEFTDTFSKQEQEISKKKRFPEHLHSSIENSSMVRRECSYCFIQFQMKTQFCLLELFCN